MFKNHQTTLKNLNKYVQLKTKDFFRSILVSTPKNRRIHSVRRFERITATEQPARDGGAERGRCICCSFCFAPDTPAYTDRTADSEQDLQGA